MATNLITREQLAQHYGKSKKTVRRWELSGLPVVILGRDRLYDPAKVDAWVLGHERCFTDPVKRGRPAGRRAA